VVTKAILFDLDRTLLDRDQAVETFAGQQYERLAAQLGHIAKQDYVTTYIALDGRGYTPKDQFCQQLLDTFEIQLSWEDLEQDRKTNFHLACVCFPGTDTLLARLQAAGLRLGIVTNGSLYQMTKIQTLKLADYFGTIVVSALAGVRKPDPAIFQLALADLDVAATETIFVGDNPVADIEGAKAVGMQTVWLRDLEVEHPAAADGVGDRFVDLLPLLERWNVL
jgi:putative hydrolase of the HAD superfamily